MIDFAAEVAALVREVAPDAGLAPRIERELRSRFGGQRVVIEARPVPTPAAIDERLLRGMRVVQIAADLGVHRATIYRHIKRPEKKSQDGGAARQATP